MTGRRKRNTLPAQWPRSRRNVTIILLCAMNAERKKQRAVLRSPDLGLKERLLGRGKNQPIVKANSSLPAMSSHIVSSLLSYCVGESFRSPDYF